MMVKQAKESISNTFRVIEDLETILHNEISGVFSKSGKRPGRKRKIIVHECK